jgi:hypothetical protein
MTRFPSPTWSYRWPLGLLVPVAALAFFTCAPAACSSGSDNHPPALDTGGTSAASAGSSGAPAGGGSSANGGDAGETNSSNSGAPGEQGSAGAPAFESDAGPGRPTPGPPACSETAVWMSPTTVANVSTTANEVLLSVTSDELDLAFLRAGALYVAHRTDASGSFTEGSAVSVPSGWTATLGAALSGDGKRLVLVSTDQTMLGELTRSARGAGFTGSIDVTAFSLLNQSTMYSGNIFASPALSPDDGQLFLNSLAPGGGSTVVVAMRSADQSWTSPTRLSSALDGEPKMRRLPTGVSADARTLFYFNEATMKEEARWRDEPSLTSPLYDMVDLGTRSGAQPNSACDRLYSQSSGDVIFERD